MSDQNASGLAPPAGTLLTPGKHALWFIFLTVLIDVMGFGIIIPVMPKLIMELTGKDEAGAAPLGGLVGFAYASMQFVCAPIMGNLSDRFGRRPVLLRSLMAFGLDYIILGFAPTYGWLFIGRMISGMCGASFTTANACVADITPPEHRAKTFGLMGAAFGLGFIFGPLLGGVLGQYGSRVPFFGAAALALINVVYGYFVLPETLPVEKRRPFSWKRANTLGAFHSLSKYPIVMSLLGAVMLYWLAHMSVQTTWGFYGMHRFKWTPFDIAMSLSFAGVTMAVVQGFLTRTLIPRLGERRAATIGLVAAILGYVGYAFSSQTWMMYVAMVVGSLAGLVGPSLNALMSREVPPNAQGELQGGVASMTSFSTIIGPLLMPFIFHHFAASDAKFYLPGAAFLCAALLVVVVMLLFLRAMRLPHMTSTVSSDIPVEPEAAPASEAIT